MTLRLRKKWKQIILNKKGVEIETHYSISRFGEVRNDLTGKKIKLNWDGNYYQVAIFNNGKRYMCKIHRLVAEAFVDNSLNKICVNHISGIKTNNFYKNLEWASYSENNQHAYDNNLKKSCDENSLAKYKNDTIHFICKNLQNGLKPKQIKLLLGYKVNDPCISVLISGIKSRKKWKKISKNYKW